MTNNIDDLIYTYANATEDQKRINYIVALRDRLTRLTATRLSIDNEIHQLTEQIKQEIEDDMDGIAD